MLGWMAVADMAPHCNRLYFGWVSGCGCGLSVSTVLTVSLATSALTLGTSQLRMRVQSGNAEEDDRHRTGCCRRGVHRHGHQVDPRARRYDSRSRPPAAGPA